MAWLQTGNKPLSEPMLYIGMLYWHIYASIGLNELKIQQKEIFLDIQ